MKSNYYIIISILFACQLSLAQHNDFIDEVVKEIGSNAIDVEYTHLVWADEFNIDGVVDSSKWFHQTQFPLGNSWFNGEEQHYTNRIENSFVDNGFLYIKAIKENFTDQGETKGYTSARLNSKFAFTYGRVDVRAKLPLGNGIWSAIWTLGKNINEDGGFWDGDFGTVNWPICGEVDIMEHGLGLDNHVSSAIHTSCNGCSGNTMNTQSITISDVANNFHVYSVNWSPDQITFLIDGISFYVYNPPVKDINTWPFFEDQYILLNLAMGGSAGTISPDFIESSMVIDYVRVYQSEPLHSNEISKKAYKIYPNPANKRIIIASNQIIDKVEVYDILGNLVLDKLGNVKNLEVSRLSPGIYLVKIFSDTKKTTKKVIIY
ncbi:family 16 glycosylhydrolase [Flavivirga sp. 57AJ16]|uniref:family 16 glycosylhydrolase n=1 Tax=Flavivirga sp. 57AJ16 TaxID=3025307 RepID=UPI002365069B|nr:family 16 glycosylhydrolase [Flavivirga sp. 57AJ16]MDD7886140.1 family 16 glycosylhydrolase [Flavivirga sp. 57AJ16]